MPRNIQNPKISNFSPIFSGVGIPLPHSGNIAGGSHILYDPYIQATNAAIAEEVKISMLRHMWYLTEECVVFSLFDRELPDNKKEEIAKAILSHPRAGVFAPQKPLFPTREMLDDSELASFVGPRSWLAFHLIDNSGEWLNRPVEEWELDDEYIDMAMVISDLSVVNDTAERCVKDIEDYANMAHDSDKREAMILVSNSHRSRIPMFTKNELENKL